MVFCDFKVAFRFLLLSGIILSSNGAKVQLFKNADFQGEMFELESTAHCTTLPTGFRNFFGSLKTTGCVVVYKDSNCSRGVGDWVYRDEIMGDGYIVRTEEARLNQLNHKYLAAKGSAEHFEVNSIRNCSYMENEPTVDADYYEMQFFNEKMVQLRDICSCTNLPQSSFKANQWRSSNTYGNCFRIFKTRDCVGEPYFTTNVVGIGALKSYFLSIEPCDIPRHCIRYTATNLTFSLLSGISTSSRSVEKNFVAINNGSTTTKKHYEGVIKMNETIQIQVAEELTKFKSITFLLSSDVDLKADPLLPANSSTTLNSAIATAFQGLRSSWNETIINGVQTTREFRAHKIYSIPSCTKYELKQFVEIAHVEIPYRVWFKLSGEWRGERMRAEAIRSDIKTFQYLNSTDNDAVLFETTMKLKLSYGSKTGVNKTEVPINECRRKFIKTAAAVTSMQPVLNDTDIAGFIRKHIITTKQTILNNGTTQQEDSYEASRRMTETAQLQFAKEMSQMFSLNFKHGLQPGIEIQNPFITNAWKELQSGLADVFKNHSVTQDINTLKMQKEKEYRVQRRISVSPCTKYQIHSFVEMVEDMEINYLVQFEVTGQLENEQITAGELTNILKDINILRNKDNFTVIGQTTTSLRLTYGVNSGVEATGSPILDCRSRFIKFSASIVNLEEISSNTSESSQAGRVVQVAPRLEFINNSTTIHEDIYEAVKQITDTASLEFPIQFYQINSMKVEERVRSKLEKSIPFLDNVWASLKSGMSATRSNWNKTISYDVQNTKEFRFQKQIVQAACMRYEVSSFIKMEEDVEIDYRVLLEVTAKLGSEPVTADEIRDNLEQFTFLNDKDDFTSIVETTMKLRLSYGESSGVDAAGMQMLDCLERQAALVANCKFTCGG